MQLNPVVQARVCQARDSLASFKLTSGDASSTDSDLTRPLRRYRVLSIICSLLHLFTEHIAMTPHHDIPEQLQSNNENPFLFVHTR
jgi:hypothetical protein